MKPYPVWAYSDADYYTFGMSPLPFLPLHNMMGPVEEDTATTTRTPLENPEWGPPAVVEGRPQQITTVRSHCVGKDMPLSPICKENRGLSRQD